MALRERECVCACMHVRVCLTAGLKRHGCYTLAALCQHKVAPRSKVLQGGEGLLYIVYDCVQSWGRWLAGKKA